MDVREAIQSFLDHRRIKRVSTSTLVLYERWLRCWTNWRESRGLDQRLERVRVDELRHYLCYLAEEHIPHSTNQRRPAAGRRGLAPASLNTVWRILSALWTFLLAEGALTDEQARFFKSGRIPRPRVPDQVRPAYDLDEIENLLDACQLDASDEEEERNRAIILMLCESGMRVAELCSLQDELVALDERHAVIIGKGGQQRFVFWGERTARALARYLEERRGAVGGPLFRGCSSRNNGGMMTPDSIRSMLHRLAKRAEVDIPQGAPAHAFRHYFARHALRLGMDGYHLQQFLGHKSSATTLRYVKESPEALKEVHDRTFGGAKRVYQ